MLTRRFPSVTIVWSIILTSCFSSPVQAQLPIINLNGLDPKVLNQDPDNVVISRCVRLDGYCLFEVAAPKSDLYKRVRGIEKNLEEVTSHYLNGESTPIKIEVRKELTTEKPVAEEATAEAKKSPDIYAVIGKEEVRLLTVTDQDVEKKGVDVDSVAEQIKEDLEAGLKRSKQERRPQFIARQGGIATGTAALMLVASLAIYRRTSLSKRSKDQLIPSSSPEVQSILAWLTRRQQFNLREVQYRLLQLTQGVILAGGTLFILSLFPYSRMLYILIIEGVNIPLRVGLASLGTYVLIRLSYALINRSTTALASHEILTSEENRRLRLRVTTISGVTKSIVTVGWIGVGTLVSLTTIGINTGPLLAGLGLIGVAVSLASQNVIKDAINGFFIILEDQYAVGDVISVADVSGLVEYMNLRITQLRDAQGRLITVPNSKIEVVANFSSNWSRADLKIPISYKTDADDALELIDQVAQAMSRDEKWQEQILAKPEVLGLDDFGERGIYIRVWIKTQPLKQWDVAREFRRRIKAALDQAGIVIPAHVDFQSDKLLPLKSSADSPVVLPLDSTDVL
ncbi:MAG: mechanosensitive ion channel family protein [Coleofasciculaceae cyanobacterium]